MHAHRHCEERSDEAIHAASRGTHGLLRFARNDGTQLSSPENIRLIVVDASANIEG
jgi:hypothetical protein